MNAIAFATQIGAISTHVLTGKVENISLHMTEAANGFGVVVFDADKQEMHQLPTLADRAAALHAMAMLRDQFYAFSPA